MIISTQRRHPTGQISRKSTAGVVWGRSVYDSELTTWELEQIDSRVATDYELEPVTTEERPGDHEFENVSSD